MKSLTGRSLIMAGLLTLLGCAGERPDDIGVREGVLSACPDSPNCVCSCENRDSHHIDPLQASLDEVRAALSQMPRNEIVRETDNYLHVEFTTRLMGFVDDVEFLAEPENGIVQVRSASRLGHSDLGVNRDRIESLRALLGSN